MLFQVDYENEEDDEDETTNAQFPDSPKAEVRPRVCKSPSWNCRADVRRLSAREEGQGKGLLTSSPTMLIVGADVRRPPSEFHISHFKFEISRKPPIVPKPKTACRNDHSWWSGDTTAPIDASER